LSRGWRMLSARRRRITELTPIVESASGFDRHRQRVATPVGGHNADAVGDRRHPSSMPAAPRSGGRTGGDRQHTAETNMNMLPAARSFRWASIQTPARSSGRSPLQRRRAARTDDQDVYIGDIHPPQQNFPRPIGRRIFVCRRFVEHCPVRFVLVIAGHLYSGVLHDDALNDQTLRRSARW